MKKYFRIKEYLSKHGSNESELARKLGVTVQYVNGIANSRLTVSHAKLVEIAGVLGCKWTDIVTDKYVADLKKKLAVEDLKAV